MKDGIKMIKINSLDFSYTGNLPFIINSLNVNIENGSYVSILGENGSAKSTLIKLMLGTLKPINGSISIETSNIGYVPQKVESFNSKFPITVNELLNCHRRTIGLKSASSIDAILTKIGILELKHSLTGNLSGGQQQKVYLAKALLGSPDLIVLDEPSTGIDVKSQQEIYSIITELNRKDGKTIVAVEHNMEAALTHSTHILRLSEGTGSFLPLREYMKEKEAE